MPISAANLKTPRVNPDWASLPLFDRTGWRKVRFGDVVENLNETVRDAGEAGIERFIGLEHMAPGSLHVRQWGNVVDGTTFTRRCRTGQVLFGKRRAYQRKAAVAEFEAVVSGDIYVLAPADNRLLPELLPFLCLSERFFEHAVGTSAGSLSPRTNWNSLASFEFDLPPLDQQRRIAEIVCAANDLDRLMADAATEAEQVRVSTVCSVYQKGMGDAELVKTRLGLRPRHWQVVPLEQHYDVKLGKMMSPKAIKGKSQRPYIRNANVQWNRLDLTDVATMSFTESEAEKFQLRYGDILACEGRHVGKSAIWRDEIPGACYQKALHRIRAMDEEQVPEFLLYQMEHHSLTGLFADQTGETTIPHLPAERLRRIHFAFPPKDEQIAIVRHIEEVADAVAKLNRRVRDNRELMMAFVDAMLTPHD